MICERCKQQGLKSRVYPDSYGTSTAMLSQVYYDEEGVHHRHDLNTSTRGFYCSQGHRWYVTSGGHCGCGWVGHPTEVKWVDPEPSEPIVAETTEDIYEVEKT